MEAICIQMITIIIIKIIISCLWVGYSALNNSYFIVIWLKISKPVRGSITSSHSLNAETYEVQQNKFRF